MGGQGASLVCREIGRQLKEHQVHSADLPTAEVVLDWIDAVRDLISTVAGRRDLKPRDFATTLVFAVSNGPQSIFAHIGDGGIVARESESGTWFCPTWPNQGEYASSTYFLTDETPPPVRICSLDWPIDAFAVFSDGIERLALNFAEQRPHEPFFGGMIKPVELADGPGKNRRLSDGLAVFLNSERVNERTDDDKTLVLAARK